MTLFDLVRYTAIATFGIGLGFMLLTNIIAFQVLRPPKKLGFLWWHVTAISYSFLALGSVSIYFISMRLGQPAAWPGLIVVSGTVTFTVAQVIIYNVERQRLVDSRAAALLARSGDER